MVGSDATNMGEGVRQGRTAEAKAYVEKAIQYQMAIEKLLKEMEKIAAFMVGLTKREYKDMIIQKKQAA